MANIQNLKPKPFTKENAKEMGARGGTNKLDNLCMCCASCNSKKRNKTEAEFKGVAI